MFASFIPAIADIVGQRQRYGGFYESTVGIRSPIITVISPLILLRSVAHYSVSVLLIPTEFRVRSVCRSGVRGKKKFTQEKKHQNSWRWRLTPLPRPGNRPSRPKAPPPLSAVRASSFSPWGPAEGISPGYCWTRAPQSLATPLILARIASTTCVCVCV